MTKGGAWKRMASTSGSTMKRVSIEEKEKKFGMGKRGQSHQKKDKGRLS